MVGVVLGVVAAGEAILAVVVMAVVAVGVEVGVDVGVVDIVGDEDAGLAKERPAISSANERRGVRHCVHLRALG